MRSGHGWAVICSQKTRARHAREVRSTRSATSRSPSGRTPRRPTRREVDALNLPVGDPARMAAFFAEMQRQNTLSNADPRPGRRGHRGDGAGPFEGCDVAHVILAGHSQTGGVVTEYILNAHDTQRLGDGSPVYHGYFPSGAPGETFGALRRADRAGGQRRRHRRPEPRRARGPRRTAATDSDEPGDRYRLYELAGVPHMGTRYPPYNDTASQWQHGRRRPATCPTDVVMNSLPHGELFNMAMHHLVAVGRRRRHAAAGRAHRGRPRRLVRQGRARQQPRRRALRRDGRPAAAVLLEPQATRTGHPRSAWSASRSPFRRRRSSSCTGTTPTTWSASTGGSTS